MIRQKGLWVVLIFILLGLLDESSRVTQAQGGSDDAGFRTPSFIHYQGRVSIGGVPFSGQGYFKFAIVDSGGFGVWANDQPLAMQGVAQGEPSTAVPLPVVEGLFSVALGDPSLQMPPLDPVVFTDPMTALRVWFSPDPDGVFVPLPDRPIASVPYALVAEDAGMLEGYVAADFASASHNHWGDSWTGSGQGLELNSSNGWGLDVITGSNSDFGTAIRGKTESSSGATVGVWGVNESDSDGAIGVWGQANGDGLSYGVFGQSASEATGTVGVFGHAQGESGLTVGVKGASDSGQGKGVHGIGHGASGIQASVTVGVLGESDRGMGVMGYTSSTADNMAAVAGGAGASTGKVHGVWGNTNSSQGYGVYGTAPHTGVAGIAEASSGATMGMVGKATSLGGTGVRGEGGFYGFYGVGTDPSGLSFGLHAETASTANDSAGVRGRSLSATGRTYGVYGESSSAHGAGVYGHGRNGVHGEAMDGSGSGVYGETNSNWNEASGVLGASYATSGVNYGVEGWTNSVTGGSSGVKGVAWADEGMVYGVYGRTNSPQGYAIYADGSAYVSGDLTVAGKLMRAPVQRTQSFAPSAFVADAGDTSYKVDPYLRNTSGGICFSEKSFLAAVTLPDGVEVKALRAFFYSNFRPYAPDPNCVIVSVKLYRRDLYTGNIDQMMRILPDEIPNEGAYSNFVTTTVINPSWKLVDNTRYAYDIEVRLPASMSGDAAIQIVGATLAYEIHEQ